MGSDMMKILRFVGESVPIWTFLPSAFEHEDQWGPVVGWSVVAGWSRRWDGELAARSQCPHDAFLFLRVAGDGAVCVNGAAN